MPLLLPNNNNRLPLFLVYYCKSTSPPSTQTHGQKSRQCIRRVGKSTKCLLRRRVPHLARNPFPATYRYYSLNSCWRASSPLLTPFLLTLFPTMKVYLYNAYEMWDRVICIFIYVMLTRDSPSPRGEAMDLRFEQK